MRPRPLLLCSSLALAGGLASVVERAPTAAGIDRIGAVVDRIRTTQRFAAGVADRCAPLVDALDALGTDPAVDEDFRARLRSCGYAVCRAPTPLAPVVDGAAALLRDDAALVAAGGAVSLSSEGRSGEYFGAYGDEATRFVDVRFDGSGRPLPRELGAFPVDAATAALADLGLRACAAAGLDPALVDDPRSDKRGAVSSTALRLAWYDASDETPFDAHTDATFLTVAPFAPGLEFYDGAAWHAPRAAAGDDLAVVWAGSLLEIVDATFAATVHRVVGTPEPRTSTPLLLRGHPAAHPLGVPMQDCWEALQKRDAGEAADYLRARLE